MNVRTDDGGEQTWNLNGNSVSHLVRQGVEGAPIQVGDTVRAIGSPSTRRPHNLSADELRLAHEITVTDPATFTTPARRTSEWMAVPGIEVRPFELDCDYNPWVVTE